MSENCNHEDKAYVIVNYLRNVVEAYCDGTQAEHHAASSLLECKYKTLVGLLSASARYNLLSLQMFGASAKGKILFPFFLVKH